MSPARHHVQSRDQRDNKNDNDKTNNSSPANASSGSGGERKRRRSDNETPQMQAACDACRSRKVKCDRQQPVCSNCRKSGVVCTSSNTFRRINHTKQLRNEFSSVLERLNDVDQTLSTLTQLTQQIVTSQTSLRRHDGNGDEARDGLDQSSLVSQSIGDFGILDVLNDASDKMTRCGHRAEQFTTTTVELEQGGIRLYSHPAPQLLIESLKRHLARVLIGAINQGGHEEDHDDDDDDDEFDNHDCSSNGDATSNGVGHSGAIQDQSVRVAVQRQLEGFPFNQPCSEPVIESDYRSVTTPPRLLVDMFLDSFLININSSIPLFNKAELHQAIESHYSGQNQNSSWALILTNIAVLGLGLETKLARASQSSPHSRSMNDDLIPSLLRNCDRVLANLQFLMRPCRANVQALATLALVAREFYGNLVFERVCQAACQLGRMLGLHRCQTHQAPVDNKNHGLFRGLYALDKQRVFMTGHLCDLYSFDSDPEVLRQGQSGGHLSDAFHQLMRIWEEMYLKLFSPKATTDPSTLNDDRSSSPSHSTRQASVMGKLKGWQQKHRRLIEVPSDDAGTASPIYHIPRQRDCQTQLPPASDHLTPMQLELKYCYHTTKVLALSHSSGTHDEGAQQQLSNSARTCLEVIAETGSPEKLNTARVVSLTRMLGYYPMVAFMYLFKSYVSSIMSLGSGSAETEAQAEADLKLLRTVHHQLSPLHDAEYPRAYLGRLEKGLGWALDIVDTVNSANLATSHAMTTASTISSVSEAPSGSSSGLMPDATALEPLFDEAPNGTHDSLMGSSLNLPSSRFGFYMPANIETNTVCHAVDMPPDFDGLDMTLDMGLQRLFTADDWNGV